MPAAIAPASCAVERPGLVEYGEAWELQRRLVEACREDGQARLLLLEHPHTYTLGPRGKSEHLLLSEAALADLGAAVQRVDRGGDVTYHGPGQLVGYPILDLRRWHQGPNWYVRSLEATLIDALAAFGIEARREPGCPGVWAGDAKIASIGVRVSRGITSHGFALNVDPDMRYFSHIVPCGLPDVRVTSMAQVLANRTMNGAASRRVSGEREGRRDRPSGLSGPQDEGPDSTDVPAMNHVMDTVAQAFGRVFGLTMENGQGRGVQLNAPTSVTNAFA